MRLFLLPAALFITRAMSVVLSAESVSGAEIMAERPTCVVIAHRGASGYLPEHTLEAKAMAHAQGAEYLEQDLVLTQDDVPIVLHDIHLDAVTNVAEVFPDRARADGRYYAIDLTLAEIRQLQVHERVDPQSGAPAFSRRFPLQPGPFRVATFEEEIAFIQGMNRSTGREAGIYPEIKQPSFHRQEGKDISPIVLEILDRYGYRERSDAAIVQCFDAAELQRIRNELNSSLTLVLLLGGSTWVPDDASDDSRRTKLNDIARYAQGIGPSLSTLFPNGADSQETARRTVELAHEAGLVVHPWTFRSDALPRGFTSSEQVHEAILQTGVDGLFSDFPDQSRRWLRQARETTSSQAN